MPVAKEVTRFKTPDRVTEGTSFNCFNISKSPISQMVRLQFLTLAWLVLLTLTFYSVTQLNGSMASDLVTAHISILELLRTSPKHKEFFFNFNQEDYTPATFSA